MCNKTTTKSTLNLYKKLFTNSINPLSLWLVRLSTLSLLFSGNSRRWFPLLRMMNKKKKLRKGLKDRIEISRCGSSWFSPSFRPLRSAIDFWGVWVQQATWLLALFDILDATKCSTKRIFNSMHAMNVI